MSRGLRRAAALGLALAASAARATPSTVVWSPATVAVQPLLVPHLTYDTYFAEKGAYGIDTGITVGVLPLEKLKAEIGIDLLYPGRTQNGLYLNAKLAVPEGALGAAAPGLSAGVYDVGFEAGVTDLDVFHVEVAKTLPLVGTVAVGAYHGLSRTLLADAHGDPARSGLMASWAGPELKTGLPGLQKVVPSADVMTGRSALGAIGAAVTLQFAQHVGLLTGPVFFLNPDVQPGRASFMWTFQLDVDLPMRAQ